MSSVASVLATLRGLGRNHVHKALRETGGEAVFAAGSISDVDRRTWEQGAVSDWLHESHDVTVTRVCGNLLGFSCGTRVATTVEVREGCYRVEAPVIGSHLEHAGVRLAKGLNDALSAVSISNRMR